MQIPNPFQMNDWEIHKFFKIILSIQFAVWGTIILDDIGLKILILRQLICFIYLIFIPGIITLRILKLHKLGNIETLLYAVGLSIAILMFTGLLINTIYPFIGISEPISATFLIITISVVVFVLNILCYIRDKDFSDLKFIDSKSILSPQTLFLCLIPFLAIFGTYLMNFYSNNILLMLLIILVAITALLIGFGKFIPKNLYPLSVFVIAISLLYHRSLMSMYLLGGDIQIELYFSRLVTANSFWDSTIVGNVNAMPSIVMLVPAYSEICGISLVWVFKIFFPLLFCLVPLGLYRVFQKQTHDKIAFLSCFFFVSLFTFYTEMVTLARQQIAEIFIVILILLVVDKNMFNIKRSFLFVVFGISLILSHYGTSYIYIFSLIFAWVLLILSENHHITKLYYNICTKFDKRINLEIMDKKSSLNGKKRTISFPLVLLLFVFILMWSIYVSNSSTFNTVVMIGNHIISSFFIDFSNPTAAHGLGVIMTEVISPLHGIAKYIHLFSQVLIVVGVMTVLLKYKYMRFRKEYVAFSLISISMCFAAIVVPYFASSFNVTRIYHLSLIFLSPFCIIGGITIFEMGNKIIKYFNKQCLFNFSMRFLSVFLVIFFLFNTGWIYEITDDNPVSFSLNNKLDSMTFGDKEVLSARWWHRFNDDDYIYADMFRKEILRGFNFEEVRHISFNFGQVANNSYIYLGTRNVIEEKLLCLTKIGPNVITGYISSGNVIDDKSKIYDSGCNIYKHSFF